MQQIPSPDTAIQTVFALYAEKGQADYIGEAVSQLEHAAQAGELALEAGADNEVALAAFFHDIGHLCAPDDAPEMAGLGIARHETIGADYLRALGFPPRLCRLVESHVQAKRYLTWRDPDYRANLSDASRQTLDWQGGPMTDAEAHAFEQDPDFYTILQLRRWDEAAKATDAPEPDLTVFKAMCAWVLRSGGGGEANVLR